MRYRVFSHQVLSVLLHQDISVPPRNYEVKQAEPVENFLNHQGQ